MKKVTRRGFIGSTTLGLGAVALGSPGCTGETAVETVDNGSETQAGLVPDPIQAFCVDFNWLFEEQEGWPNLFARPGHWADADAQKHVAWYKNLGANVIQTFAVSCNGYSWYKDGFVPSQPGLEDDFLTEVVRRGHEEGLMVMGYFCAAANTKFAMDHPELSYGTPSTQHLPFTTPYLDYLSRSIEDAVKKTGMDGFMIDWVWNPNDSVREEGWIDAEKELFTEILGNPFPSQGLPDEEEILAYERAAIERCWSRVQDAGKGADPDCQIWLSCSRIQDPTVVDSQMFREVDWLMNEHFDTSHFEAAQEMKGDHTRLLQCLVGWKDHDAKAYFQRLENEERDLYGFAIPTETSLPLPIEEYLSRPIESFTGDDRISANHRNIATLARYYNGLDLDAVIA